MLVIRVKVQVRAQTKAAFIATMQDSIPVSTAFEGCEHFALYQDVNDEHTLLLYEEWETQQHFDAYRASEHFKESGAVLFPLMDGAPDSAYFSAEKVD